MAQPRLIFLAGPNGAGKSTFFELYLKHSGLPFVNADRIAASMDISDVEAAATADAVREKLLAERASFITETVFSDPVGAKLRFLRTAVATGYRVQVYFVGLASAQLSAARVMQRVQTGGHDVPPERLERCFRQSVENLASALAFVPEAHVFDNSSSTQPYRLLLSLRDGHREFMAKSLPAWTAPLKLA